MVLKLFVEFKGNFMGVCLYFLGGWLVKSMKLKAYSLMGASNDVVYKKTLK